MPHRVVLTLASTGRQVDVWDGYTVALDLLAPGSAWSFAFWHSTTRESTWDVLLDEVKLFDRVTLTIDGAMQLNGTIEEMEDRSSKNEGASLVVSGRDLAGPLIDWDADPRITLRSTTLADVVTRLCQPLGVPVFVADADEARAVQSTVRSVRRTLVRRHPPRNRVDLAHPRPGERIWQMLDRVCRKVGLLPWVAPTSNGQLALVIDAPKTSGTPVYRFLRALDARGRVSAESNILSHQHRVQVRDVPTAISVCSQPLRGDTEPARFLSTAVNGLLVASPYVLGTGPAHERFFRSSLARSKDAAQREAERLMAEANARFRTYTATVRGHGQDVDGAMQLYAINSVAHVRDDLRRIDEDMLVTRVEFKGSRGAGQTTTVTMVPLGAITVIPEPET